MKFDWPRVTLLSGDGSYYNQESFDEELCTWMKNDMTANMATLFEREFFKGQISRATAKPWTRNLAFRELQLEYNIFP